MTAAGAQPTTAPEAGRTRRTTVVAVALLVASLGFVLGTVILAVGHRAHGDQLDAAALAVLVFVLSCLSMGMLVATRRPSLPIGWLMLSAGLGYSVAGFATSAVPLIHSPRSVFLYLDVLSGWIWGASITLIGVFLPLRFPDGNLPSRRWRYLEWAVAAALVLFAVGTTVKPVTVDRGFTNPLALPSPIGDVVGSLTVAFAVPFFASFAALVSVFIRYRRSRGIEREQLKWVVYAAVVIGVGLVVEFLLPDLVHDQNLADDITNVTSTLSIALLPIAIGIAVLRYRLWDIDRLINRTIVYAILTLLLVAVYGGLVVGLGAITGRTGNPVVIAASTLVVAALFGPARRRIQLVIDRRFFRRRYDAERVLTSFSARLRDELDLESLSGELQAVVVEAVQPQAVGVWIRDAEARA
ncbi:MAG TPA: hypothetical protein VID47_05955 [Actinomycetota bacterium]